jgi:hypothetical protein
MNSSEARLIEEGWAALVDRLGLAEATRFVMLLDRRTGGALRHLNYVRMHASSRSPSLSGTRGHEEERALSHFLTQQDEPPHWHDHA